MAWAAAIAVCAMLAIRVLGAGAASDRGWLQ